MNFKVYIKYINTNIIKKLEQKLVRKDISRDDI